MATPAVGPLQPSVFDMRATVDFMRDLFEYKKLARIDIALLAMRVKENTHSLQHLRDFCEHLPFPLLGVVRDTQNYVHLAAQGLTLFDVPPGRVQRDLQQWEPICRWLDEPSRPQPSGKVDPDARY